MKKKFKGEVKSIVSSQYNCTYHKEGKLDHKSYYNFDEYENIVDYKLIGKDGVVLEEYKSEIDNYGNVIQRKGFDRRGGKFRLDYLYYDNVILGSNLFYDEKLALTTINMYDKKGILKKKYDFYTGVDRFNYEKYKYDNIGNNIKTMYIDARSEGWTQRDFNEQGFVEFSRTFSSGGYRETSDYSYEYDYRGNWVLKKWSSSDLQIVFKSEIEYF
jgi:hypothetical protein